MHGKTLMYGRWNCRHLSRFLWSYSIYEDVGHFVQRCWRSMCTLMEAPKWILNAPSNLGYLRAPASTCEHTHFARTLPICCVLRPGFTLVTVLSFCLARARIIVHHSPVWTPSYIFCFKGEDQPLVQSRDTDWKKGKSSHGVERCAFT